MRTSHSIVFFVLMLIAIAFIFVFIFKEKPMEQKLLLETLSCQSDKIDSSIYNLRGDTELIGAFIAFKNVPISDETRKYLSDLSIVIQEGTWIFDYVLAEIPTDSLCQLLASEEVVRVSTLNLEKASYNSN